MEATTNTSVDERDRWRARIEQALEELRGQDDVAPALRESEDVDVDADAETEVERSETSER